MTLSVTLLQHRTDGTRRLAFTVVRCLTVTLRAGSLYVSRPAKQCRMNGDLQRLGTLKVKDAVLTHRLHANIVWLTFEGDVEVLAGVRTRIWPKRLTAGCHATRLLLLTQLYHYLKQISVKLLLFYLFIIVIVETRDTSVCLFLFTIPACESAVANVHYSWQLTQGTI